MREIALFLQRAETESETEAPESRTIIWINQSLQSWKKLYTEKQSHKNLLLFRWRWRRKWSLKRFIVDANCKKNSYSAMRCNFSFFVANYTPKHDRAWQNTKPKGNFQKHNLRWGEWVIVFIVVAFMLQRTDRLLFHTIGIFRFMNDLVRRTHIFVSCFEMKDTLEILWQIWKTIGKLETKHQS